MNRFSCFLFLFFFILNNCITAQVNPKIPAWVNTVEIRNTHAVNKNDITEGYYYLLFDEQYNTLVRENYFHYAKQIVNEEALTSVSQIEFSYDPSYEKGILHFVKVIRNGVVIDKTKQLDFKILNEENQRNIGLLSGRKTFYTNLTDIRKGDIVEFSFSINGENPIMHNYFNFSLPMGYSDPIDQIYFRVLFSKESTLNILNKNTTIKPIIKQSSINDYVWKAVSPPTIKMESGYPAGYDRYPSVQLSNLKNWMEVKEHCKSVFKLPPYNHAPLISIIDSITKLHKDKVKQITCLVDFVQKNIRYSGNENGIYSNVPRTPDYVLKKRFGDCKEKSVLLNELLKLIQVDAYPMLINTVLQEKTPDHVPAIHSFDHCISSFTYAGQRYFIDPTMSYQSGNFELRLPPFYRTGMILDTTKIPFTTIPVPVNSSVNVTEEFENSDTTDTRLKVTSVFTGTDADELRYYLHANSLSEVQEAYKKFYTRYCDLIEVLDTLAIADNEEKNEITIVEHYLLKKFWMPDDSSNSVIIKKDFLPYSLNSKLIYGEERTRKDFLQINHPLNYTQTIIVKHTNGWNIKEESITEKNNFFDYTYSKKANGNILELNYHYRTHTGVIAPKDYPDYKSKMEFVNRNMTLSIQETPYKKESTGFNWLLLLTIACGLFLASILIWYLNAHPYKSRFENRYSTVGGWLILIAIGVMITPLSYLLEMYKQWDTEKDINYYYYFFHEESHFFSPLKGYYTLFTILFNAMMLVYAVFLVTIFFQRRASFRVHYTLFKLISVLFLTIDVIILYQNDPDSTLEGRRLFTRQTASLIGLFISACIWVPYVWLSERSRHTFTSETGDEEEYETYHQQP